MLQQACNLSQLKYKCEEREFKSNLSCKESQRTACVVRPRLKQQNKSKIFQNLLVYVKVSIEKKLCV